MVFCSNPLTIPGASFFASGVPHPEPEVRTVSGENGLVLLGAGSLNHFTKRGDDNTDFEVI